MATVFKRKKDQRRKGSKWMVKWFDAEPQKWRDKTGYTDKEASLELGRRRKELSPSNLTKIECSQNVFELMKPELIDKSHEEFWIVLLNRANSVLKKQCISSGGISGTVVDPKLIFKTALDELASSIILVHNHPSGNLQPSEADIRLTQKLKKSGDLLEIAVLDHIIFTDHNFLSFADENLL